MKKLHLVGFTPDSDGLILSVRKGSKTGGYVVDLDDELVASLDRARRQAEGGDASDEPVTATAVAPARPRTRSALTPREIQARLRAGSTIADVATAAGVGDEWVQRFAAPILAEQAQVVQRAQQMTFAKARLGPSIEPLAPSVQWNLSDRGVRFSDDVFGDCWSAFNLHGTRWAVRFSYYSRRRHQVAEWEVDLRDQRLTARNRLAADLAHVEAGRRPPEPEAAEPNALSAPPDVAPEAPPSVARKMAARRTAKKARPTPVVPAAKAAADAATLPARKATGRAPVTDPVPAPAPPPATRKKAAATNVAAKKGAVEKASARKVAATKVGATKSAATKVGPARPARASAEGRPAFAGAATPGAAAKTPGRAASRQSSPRKRPAKKPPGDTPGADPAVEAADERPSHLARPPSPMKTANRATNLPGRHARPVPSPPPLPVERRAAPAPPTAPKAQARPAENDLAVAEESAPVSAAPSARIDAPAAGATAGRATRSPSVRTVVAEPAPRPADSPERRPVATAPRRPATPPVAPPIRRPPPSTPEVAASDAEGPAVVILPKAPPGAGRPGAAVRGRPAAPTRSPATAPGPSGDDDAAWSSFAAAEGSNGSGGPPGRSGGRRPRGG